MRVLGIDPGQRRIGLALSDEDHRLALPRETVTRGKSDADAAKAVLAAVVDEEIERIIVGLPLRLDGTEGAAARSARRFGAALEALVEVPITFWDERLTTAFAERSLQSIGVRGSARRKVVDQSAAALLLQSYLDAQSETSWGDEHIEADAVHAERRRGRGRSRG